MPKNKGAIYSDLKKLDAHVVEPHEYAEAPELTDEELAAAVVRRGRPPSAQRKSAVKLRLDSDIVNALRASGPGWMTRVNAMLRGVVLGQVKVKVKRSAAAAGKSKTLKRRRAAS